MTTLTRGLTYTEAITVTTPAGAADDLTGGTFLAEIRDRSGGIVDDISAGFTLRNGSLNIIDWVLTPAETWALAAGTYEWDLVVDLAGVKTFVIPTEQIKIATPATRPLEV